MAAEKNSAELIIMNRLISYFNEENNQPLNQHELSISSPANSTLQRSYYIAAIGKFTRHEGLQSPVTNIYKGERCTFDFFCLESKQLFKVLSLDELDEYDKYLEHPGKVSIIVDLELGNEPVFRAVVAEREVIIVSREVTARLHAPGHTLLYYGRQLWERDDIVDGLGFWSRLVPVVLLEQEFDEMDEE